MSRETISLGKIGFLDRGEYIDNITYKKWDMVTFEGSSYVLIHEGLVEGISPTTESYWKCVARKGDKGVAGASVEATSIAVGKYKWEYNEDDESLSLFFINQ